MSKFKEARAAAREAARQRARPSALLLAWCGVLLVVGATIAWLALTAPNQPTPPVNTVAGVAPERTEPELEVETDGVAEPAAAPHETIASAPVPGPKPAPTASLAPAPASGLIEDSPNGPLPKIATDGRESWQVYARPYDAATTKPRIALVISGLGLGKLATETAIESLPPAVTLAFSPYGHVLQGRVDQARAAGHEVLLLIPLEPNNYPQNDPGPHTLRLAAAPDENLARLHWLLGRFTGYAGLLNDMGSRFTASEQAMTPLLEEVKARGLLFMDAKATQHSVAAKLARELRVPRAVNNRYIDNDANEDDIRRRLEELETLAQTYGAAAGVGRPTPVTLKTVAAWAEGLAARGFELVPLTAVANRQPIR